MRLLERATFAKGKVDRATGIFQRVKILNPVSKNKRYYPPDVLAKSAGLYENAVVNINHARNGEPLRLYRPIWRFEKCPTGGGEFAGRPSRESQASLV